MRRTPFSNELRMEVVVGAFVVMVFLGLAYFTIILSREKLFGQKHMIEVVFDDVMGLRDGDNVVIRGMVIGKVKRLDLREDGVHVLASLEQPLEIHEGYRMTIVSTSILGGRYIHIKESQPSGGKIPMDSVFRGERPYDLMADAAEVVNTVRRALTTGGVVSNVQDIAAQVREIVARANSGQGTLGKLLSADDTLYSNAVAAATNLREISERANRGEGTLGRLLSPDDALYNDIASAASSLRKIASEVEEGKGTVGKLLKDDGFYEDVKKAVNEVRATIDDYRETAPIVTFTSIFFGAF
mgnify:FL=1